MSHILAHHMHIGHGDVHVVHYSRIVDRDRRVRNHSLCRVLARWSATLDAFVEIVVNAHEVFGKLQVLGSEIVLVHLGVLLRQSFDLFDVEFVLMTLTVNVSFHP